MSRLLNDILVCKSIGPGKPIAIVTFYANVLIMELIRNKKNFFASTFYISDIYINGCFCNTTFINIISLIIYIYTIPPKLSNLTSSIPIVNLHMVVFIEHLYKAMSIC